MPARARGAGRARDARVAVRQGGLALRRLTLTLTPTLTLTLTLILTLALALTLTLTPTLTLTKAASLYDETLAALDRQAPLEQGSPPPTPPSPGSASAASRTSSAKGGAPPATAAAAAAAAGTEPAGARGPAFRARAARGRALLGAGVAYAMEKQLGKALERLDAAVALRAHCGRTLFNRGVLHLLLEQWEPAELDLLGCVAKLPLESEAWRHKHTAVVKQGAVGRKREALIDYANALLLTDFFKEG